MSEHHNELVMTLIGPDRPGLVEAVSTLIADHGGNWLESRMAHLGGQFAGILRVHVARDRVDDLVSALKRLDNRGLGVIVQSGGETTPGETTRRVQLELTGSDHPGIVRHITQALASRGVNIEELSTSVTGSPMSGIPMFVASALLQVPGGVELDQLRRALEQVAADLMVDISLDEPRR